MTLYKGISFKKASPLNRPEHAIVTFAINADLPENKFFGWVPLATVDNRKQQ